NQCIVYFIINAVQLANRCGDIIEQKDMKHNRSDSHLALQHEISRQDNDDYYAYLFYETFYTVKHETDPPGLHLVFRHVYLNALVFFSFQRFPYERFDDCYRIYETDNRIALGFAVGAHSSAKSAQLSRLYPADEKIERKNAQTHQSNIKISPEHEH